MSFGMDLPVVDQAGAAPAATNPLPGTFIGLGLGGAIPDVMGLRAIQPRAAVMKVMSVLDIRCVRVIVPDDHVSNGFHEILIHDG